MQSSGPQKKYHGWRHGRQFSTKKYGLLDRVEASRTGGGEAEHQTLDFLKKWVSENTASLCGNSIWIDRRFLHKEMPALEGYLHYCMIEVSPVKELVRRWYPKLSVPDKHGSNWPS